MNKSLFSTAFVLGAAAVIWMGSIFVGSDALALTITFVIGVAYTLGFVELLKYRQATATLANALGDIPEQLDVLDPWVNKLAPSLQNSVQLRIEGERVALPSPVLTPYLVGLLVMLGLLGTFVGMVDTLKGAVVALEGSTELEAIRAGLAAPINGLGLAFGTSVAGVAASAMLGLMSTLSRSERMNQAGRLDGNIKTVFRGFSLYHNRQQTYKAMQNQAKALPEVAATLQAMAGKLEQMGERLSDSLTSNQQAFHQSVQTVYSDLASSVEQSLRETVADSGRLAGESIKPVLASAMDEITTKLTGAVQDSHQQLTSTAQGQLAAVGEQFTDMASTLQQSLDKSSVNLLEQQKESDQQRLAVWAETFSEAQQSAANELMSTSQQLGEELKQLSANQQSAFSTTTENLEKLSSSLNTQLQQSAQQALSNQQQVSTNLQEAAQSIADAGKQSTAEMVAKVGELLQSSENLVQARVETEQQWLQAHGERMQEISAVVQTELSGLTLEEQRRSDAAVERLAGLEQTVAEHLASLGKELEEPMVRLIEIASETPKAAAEVISQLRGEISNNIERDNQLLAEREQIMQQLTALSASLEQSSAGQRAAMEGLMNNSASLLKEVGGQFSEQVESEAAKLADTTAGQRAAIEELVKSSAAMLQEVGGQFREHMNTEASKLVETTVGQREAIDELVTTSATMLKGVGEQFSEHMTAEANKLAETAVGQREAIAELMDSSAVMLKDVGGHFTEHVNNEATKLAETAALFASGTTEMSSLGEAFTVAVQLFNESNQQLMESLTRIESTLDQSSARSDEQLGYYVAQAREIIDHSILSQKQMIEELRQLGKQEDLFAEPELVAS